MFVNSKSQKKKQIGTIYFKKNYKKINKFQQFEFGPSLQAVTHPPVITPRQKAAI